MRLAPASLAVLATLATTALGGCGGDETSDPQAGPPAPDAGDAGGGPQCEPGQRLVEGGACLPAGVPADACAAGFESTGDGGCRAILPAEACPDGEVALLGETSCHETQPCGAEPWGDVATDASTEFVDASYMGGSSDGSQAKPWTAIQAAIDAAEPGAVVAIAAGTYPADLSIAGKPVRLRGRCPALVAIDGTGVETGAIFVEGGASGTEIAGLAVSGKKLGIIVSGAEDVVLERLWIHGTDQRAVDVEDTLGDTSVIVRDMLIEEAVDTGILIIGAKATIERTVVREGRPLGTSFGRGIGIQPGQFSNARADVTVRGVVLEANRDAALYVGGSDAVIEATLVRDTLPRLDDKYGWGLWFQQDLASSERASVTVRQTVVERSHEIGVVVDGADVTMETTTLRDTQLNPSDPLSGFGLLAMFKEKSGDRAALTLRSSLVAGHRSIGVYVLGSDAVIDSTVVRDILPGGDPTPLGGRGINVEWNGLGQRAMVTVTASVVERAHEDGIAVLSSDAVIENTLVRDTQPQASDGRFGRGVNVQPDLFGGGAPSTALIRGCRVERSYDAGIAVLLSSATIEDSVIADTRPLQADGGFGDGVVVLDLDGESSLTISGSRIERSSRAGIACFSSTATVSSTQLDCNPIHLDGEVNVNGAPYVFSDGGGNACGCEGAAVECKVLSSNLAPPEAP